MVVQPQQLYPQAPREKSVNSLFGKNNDKRIGNKVIVDCIASYERLEHNIIRIHSIIIT